MIQRNKKRTSIILIIVIILAIAVGTVVLNKYVINKNSNIKIDTQDILDFSSKRLIVVTDGVLTDTYNAKNIKKTYYGNYIITYETEQETENAYNKFKTNNEIKDVQIDSNMELIENEKLNIKYNIQDVTFENWGTYAMGLNETQDIINQKSNNDEIVVAVIDTGFDLSLSILDEQNLRERIDERYINITDGSKNISDDTIPYGENQVSGHGTNVGGIILDATPSNVKILPIKVDDQSLVGENNRDGMAEIYTLEAIEYAINQEVDIINMSLGGTNSAGLEEVIDRAIAENIVVVSATGNDGIEGVVYPAAIDDVIAVGALKTSKFDGEFYTNQVIEAIATEPENLSIAEFSNYGNEVDFTAPGKNILSLIPAELIRENSLSFSWGTSQASPHIASAVATIKSYNKNWTNDEIYEILEYYSLDLGDEGKDKYYGHGMPYFKNYEECTCGCENCKGIYCFGCTCEDCIFHNRKTLERIEITTNPTKTEYVEGQDFDPTGMVVTAYYDDGSSKEISASNYTYEPAGHLSTDDTKITIIYEDKEATVDIVVEEIKIISAVLTKLPDKVVYEEGEYFDPTGMEITITYNNEDIYIMKNEDLDGLRNLVLEKENTYITAYVGEIEITIPITVNEKNVEPEPETTLVELRITKNPDKMEYEEGEDFDPTGLVIEALFSDESTRIIDNNLYGEYWPRNMQAGNKTITISYTYNGITKSASLTLNIQTKIVNPEPEPEATLVELRITKNPDKMEYEEGEYFDSTGMVVEAIYNDGNSKVITNYQTFPTTALTPSNNVATIRYTEDGNTVTTTVRIIVNAINNNENTNTNTSTNTNTNTNNNTPTNTNTNTNNNTPTNTNTNANNNTPTNTNTNIATNTHTSNNITNTKDNTIKNGAIANTGKITYIIPAIMGIIAIGVIVVIKYREYKDI